MPTSNSRLGSNVKYRFAHFFYITENLNRKNENRTVNLAVILLMIVINTKRTLNKKYFKQDISLFNSHILHLPNFTFTK